MFLNDPYRIAQINALSVNMCCAFELFMMKQSDQIFLSISAHVNNAFLHSKGRLMDVAVLEQEKAVHIGKT